MSFFKKEKNQEEREHQLFYFSSEMVAFKIDTRSTWKGFRGDKGDPYMENQRNKLQRWHLVSKEGSKNTYLKTSMN